MENMAGINIQNDYNGDPRYMTIDLEKYGDNESLMDFIDGLQANVRMLKGDVISKEAFLEQYRKEKKKKDDNS